MKWTKEQSDVINTRNCNYYNKQRMKFLEDMDLFSEEVDKNE